MKYNLLKYDGKKFKKIGVGKCEIKTKRKLLNDSDWAFAFVYNVKIGDWRENLISLGVKMTRDEVLQKVKEIKPDIEITESNYKIRFLESRFLYY